MLDTASDFILQPVQSEVREIHASYDLCMIHGNIASNKWWYPVAESWAKTENVLEPLRKMVFCELRGCGSSPGTPANYQLQLQDLVQDSLAVVKKHHLKKTVLVGHSTGGLVAALMMAQAPELFEGAFLLDPVGPHGVVFDDQLLERYNKMKGDREMVAQVIGATIYNNDFLSDFFQKVIVEETLLSMEKAGASILLALRGINVSSEIQKIQKPVCIVRGDLDWVLDESHSLQLMQLISQSEFMTIKNQGHCLNMEDPSKMVELLRNFLLKLSASQK